MKWQTSYIGNKTITLTDCGKNTHLSKMFNKSTHLSTIESFSVRRPMIIFREMNESKMNWGKKISNKKSHTKHLKKQPYQIGS